jgi:hypothetical protein
LTVNITVLFTVLRVGVMTTVDVGAGSVTVTIPVFELDEDVLEELELDGVDVAVRTMLAISDASAWACDVGFAVLVLLVDVVEEDEVGWISGCAGAAVTVTTLPPCGIMKFGAMLMAGCAQSHTSTPVWTRRCGRLLHRPMAV